MIKLIFIQLNDAPVLHDNVITIYVGTLFPKRSIKKE